VKVRFSEVAPYAALLAGAAYLYHDTRRFAALGRPGQLGPDFWPKAVLVLLIAVCAIEIVRRVLAAGAAPERAAPRAEAPAQAHDEEPPREWRLLAAGIGLTVLYVPGIEYLGFFLATIVFLAAFMWVGRYRRPRIVAAASIVGSFAFVFVFMKVVYVSLPLGWGPFRVFSAWIMAALGIR
jgi:putative tricarboxylic transport membrane protein